jgi:hypothetical protein
MPVARRFGSVPPAENRGLIASFQPGGLARQASFGRLAVREPIDGDDIALANAAPELPSTLEACIGVPGGDLPSMGALSSLQLGRGGQRLQGGGDTKGASSPGLANRGARANASAPCRAMARPTRPRWLGLWEMRW